MGTRKVQADDIYRLHTLHTLPHRWRIRQAIYALKSLGRRFATYADVGCADGFVTHQIASALKPDHTVGFELQQHIVEAAQKRFPAISFRQWNMTAEGPPDAKFDLVTCMETLEHVLDVEFALKNLLAITGKVLYITVPVEIGPIGLAKFGAKVLLGKPVLNSEHRGSKSEYAIRLLRGGPVSQFRQPPRTRVLDTTYRLRLSRARCRPPQAAGNFHCDKPGLEPFLHSAASTELKAVAPSGSAVALT